MELIAVTILGSSFIGIVTLLFRKIPVLLELSEEGAIAGENFSAKWLSRIRNFPFLKSVSVEMFLQKILLRAKVLVLKIENKIAFWSEALKDKAQKKKIYENDNYWKELNRKPNDLENLSRRKEKTK